MRKVLACLPFIFCFPSDAAEPYSTIGVVHPFVEWNCDGFFCGETTPAIVMIGFGGRLDDGGLFFEGDGFVTVDKGDVNSLDGSGPYSVNGLGLHGGWRTGGTVSLSLRAGLSYTQIDGPERAPASEAGFGPVFGMGLGLGEHLTLELRVLNEHANTLNASWRFQ